MLERTDDRTHGQVDGVVDEMDGKDGRVDGGRADERKMRMDESGSRGRTIVDITNAIINISITTTAIISGEQ